MLQQQELYEKADGILFHKRAKEQGDEIGHIVHHQKRYQNIIYWKEKNTTGPERASRSRPSK